MRNFSLPLHTGLTSQASDYMGITNRTGARKSALSSDVLRIELHGSSRAHFGILDVPGIFHATIDGVTTREDLQKVRSLVISYMKKPGNVIMYVLVAVLISPRAIS